MHKAVALEQDLLTPETRANATRLAALIADDFIEIGASGSVWRKADILASLPGETHELHEMSEIETRDLAEGLVLVTYRLTSPDRITRRSSIWRFNGGWQIIWHQGTVVSVCENRMRV